MDHSGCWKTKTLDIFIATLPLASPSDAVALRHYAPRTARATIGIGRPCAHRLVTRVDFRASMMVLMTFVRNHEVGTDGGAPPLAHLRCRTARNRRDFRR